MKLIKGLFVGTALTVAPSTACSPSNDSKLAVSDLGPAEFDTTLNEKLVKLFVLKDGSDMKVYVTSFGVRVVSICVSSKADVAIDVVLGYDNIAQYADSISNANDLDTIINHYANRISQDRVTVIEKKVRLPRNNFGYCLHGGPSGWQYSVYEGNQSNDSTLQPVLRSPDGDNNFPGDVAVTITYTVANGDTLDMKLEATTDAETVISITNHSYFNLSGDPSKAGTNIVLYANANNYTPYDSTFMTAGKTKPVYGTSMDFAKRHVLYKTIGDTIFIQLKYGEGYDHNYTLSTYKDGKGDDTEMTASLYSPGSSTYMEVYTDEPGIQVYSGNFLSGSVAGKKGTAYPQCVSVCLET